MNPELLLFHAEVLKCTRPEDLFGDLGIDPTLMLHTLKTLYRKFAMVSHADRYRTLEEQRIATVAFAKLNELNQQAIAKINAKTYGTVAAASTVVIKGKKDTYTIISPLAGGDISNVYLADRASGGQAVVKVAKSPDCNGFISGVEQIALEELNKLAANTVSYKQFIPQLIESFKIRTPPTSGDLAVNVTAFKPGRRTLQEVFSQHPEGIGERHFVWVFNRLLTTLSFVHQQGLVHGSVLPANVLVHPVDHSILLVGWSFAQPTGERISAISKGYDSFYPPEVWAKLPATSAADIYMAAMCMCYLLGAEFGIGLETKVRPKFRRFLESCLLKNPARRQSSAWSAYEELNEIAATVLGPKKYVKLEMV